jgi:hypothetical protein
VAADEAVLNKELKNPLKTSPFNKLLELYMVHMNTLLKTAVRIGKQVDEQTKNDFILGILP